ncbi:uncharacterized protein N7459_003537 [Penicillium hispanicum]|uniref:uncharacterized protein n=1 Tax=Penicillium hispanicum TaxID=1080232 RepID=UPI0025424476|nr:uncharacterized protein N7459_003537 [Penicillium hispanicum]KAJ5587772.1 hypothetical protein N7459_003537 [Penicillium hispanicum]
MSSGFVSAGTNEKPVERDDEWLRVQQELEEERRRKAEIGQQDGGKSLYEVLQQNKSELSPSLLAKQEAFEEKTRLKNQFRSLDEDEVEFLDSVLESTRAQEAAVKKDTADQLEAFRKQREEAEKAMLGPTSSEIAPTEEEEWNISARKRRRDKGKDLLLPGKKRKASATESSKEPGTSKGQESSQHAQEASSTTGKEAMKAKADQTTTSPEKANPTNSTQNDTSNARKSSSKEKSPPDTKQPPKPAPVSLGLAAYGSDSDSE